MIQFLTRIPINISLPCEMEDFKRGASLFPIVGAIIGGLEFLIFIILKNFLPFNITSTITVLVGIIITGAIHLDGIGDSCDGFYSLKESSKIIEIMKDSRIGTYGAIAIIFDILLKIFSIEFIGNTFPLYIILVPIISRTLMTFIFYIGNTAKKTGTGNFFIGNVGIKEVFIAFSICIPITLIILGVNGLILIGILIIFTIIFNKYCNFKIGGLTGDTLGALNELLEILGFLILIGMR